MSTASRDRFELADVVVDVGVHIGAFAHAALIRGCGHVHGVEADLENLRIATENLRRYIDDGAVTLTYGAAWRSDFNDDDLSIHGYPSYGRTVNTGGGRVLPRGTANLYPRSTLTCSCWVRHGGVRSEFGSSSSTARARSGRSFSPRSGSTWSTRSPESSTNSGRTGRIPAMSILG